MKVTYENSHYFFVWIFLIAYEFRIFVELKQLIELWLILILIFHHPDYRINL